MTIAMVGARYIFDFPRYLCTAYLGLAIRSRGGPSWFPVQSRKECAKLADLKDVGEAFGEVW